MLYGQPVADLSALGQQLQQNASLVFAPMGYSMPYSADFASPQWRDWNLVMSERCAAALDDGAGLENASNPRYDGSRRC